MCELSDTTWFSTEAKKNVFNAYNYYFWDGLFTSWACWTIRCNPVILKQRKISFICVIIIFWDGSFTERICHWNWLFISFSQMLHRSTPWTLFSTRCGRRWPSIMFMYSSSAPATSRLTSRTTRSRRTDRVTEVKTGADGLKTRRESRICECHWELR